MASPILGWGLFGISIVRAEIINNWGTITTDWNNLWSTSQTGRVGTDNGGGGSNRGGITITPRITGGTGVIITLPGGGTILPTEPTVGTATGDFRVGNSAKWSVGFSNGYIRNLRKALGNPLVHGICWTVAGLAAVSLWTYETEESARQNVDAETGADSIFGASLTSCYALAAIGVGVAGSL